MSLTASVVSFSRLLAAAFFQTRQSFWIQEDLSIDFIYVIEHSLC